KTDLPRVVVIGGGFAGLAVVRELRKANVQLVMFDRYNYHTFQPLLYQVATAGLEPDSVAGPLRKIFRKQRNFYFRMAEVMKINPDSCCIETSIGSLKYDYLVLAHGSRVNYFGNEHIAEHALPLKQLPQALDMRHHILQAMEQALLQKDEREKQRLMNFVVVGGGPTGVEVAGALAELKLHVLPNDHPELDLDKMNIQLIEGGDVLLAGMSEAASRKSERYLKEFGVEIRKELFVKDYNGKTVVLSNGESIETATLVWAAGVTGNLIEGFSEEQLSKDNRLLVNRYSQVEGYERIFAVGDAAQMSTEDFPKGHPMLAPVAMQQGKLLGKNIKRWLEEKPVEEFTYFDKGSMATVGRNRAVADLPNKMNLGGILAWFAWLFVHLVFIVGFRNKLSTLLNWIWNYFTYDRATRLIVRPFVNQYRYFKD
ncbi:MAG: NAD(P)/FAD-dependent oxidoreductase, partial [Bacteroidota bacterium]